MELDPKTKVLLSDLRNTILQRGTELPVEDYSLSGVEIQGYTLGSLLGCGAAGVVFEATSSQGEARAIKILAKNENTDAERAALFEREVKIGQHVQHSALVTTFETFEFGPAQFVVMERVHGQTLDHLSQSGPSKESFLKAFESLAAGLQAAHDQGVVHRDLKPDNVMLTQDGRVKILDFGMARLVHDVSVTATGTFKGTVKYTSPEQLKDSKRAGPASDQYALGLMMFEALSGEFPFEVNEKLPMMTIMAKLTQPAKSLAEVSSEHSETLSQVFSKILAAEPEERYLSVSEAFQAVKAELL